METKNRSSVVKQVLTYILAIVLIKPIQVVLGVLLILLFSMFSDISKEAAGNIGALSSILGLIIPLYLAYRYLHRKPKEVIK